MNDATPIGMGCAGDPADVSIGSCPGRLLGAFVFYGLTQLHDDPVLIVLGACGHHQEVIARHAEMVSVSDGLWIDGDAREISDAMNLILDDDDDGYWMPNVALQNLTG